MFIVARILRVFAGIVACLALLLTTFCVWRVVTDSVRGREPRQLRCADVLVDSVIIGLVSGGIFTASFIAYRKTTAWEHRLHGSPAV
jgi:hypothetical protein